MIYNNSDIIDLVGKLKSKKDWWVKEYEKAGGKGKFINTTPFYAKGPVVWLDGYNIVTYYKIVTLELIPALAAIYKQVEEAVDAIGRTNSITYEGGNLTSFKNYKDLMDEIGANRALTTSHEYKLTESCCKKIYHTDESTLITTVNGMQETYNNNASNNADSFIYQQTEPDRFIKEVSETSIKDVYNSRYEFSTTPVPATTPSTTPSTTAFDAKQQWYADYYGKKSS